MKDMWKAGIVVIVCLSVILELTPLVLFRNGSDASGQNPPPWPPNGPPPPVVPNFEPTQDCQQYTAFTTRSEIEERVTAEWNDPSNPTAGGGFGWFGGPTLGSPQTDTSQIGLAGDSATRDYSETNTQVANVDEQDIVKTDGTYIYTISDSEVIVLKAYPTDQAGIVSRIQFDAWPIGLFVDNDRLVVIGGYSYENYWSPYNRSYDSSDTHVSLFNIADPANPISIQEYAISGAFADARMVDGFVYVITTDFLYDYGQGVSLPAITVGTQTEDLPPAEIGYFKNETFGNAVTLILAIDAAGDGAYSAEGYLTGGYGVLYVSYDHMYIAVTSYDYLTNEGYYEMLEKTTIHKIAFSELDTAYVCSGVVPGRLLNQFSMDEYESNLRVATTTGQMGWGGGGSSSNVYVLDTEMALLGKLEGLAPGEQIYSSRFFGERAYIVTYMRIDPFFVIDLSDAANPKLVGTLEVPGFSDYLHPYGDDHVIGIGQDTLVDPSGGFSWFQGLKLSLFDVTDVANPAEEDKVVIGDRGTTSEAQDDHRAFMFDEERGILAFPVSLYEDESNPDPNGWNWTYGSYVYQGVYVYQVSLDGGFQFVGRVTHGSVGQPYYYDTLSVRRSLYIEDVLYTISTGMVKMNAIGDLAEIGSIEL